VSKEIFYIPFIGTNRFENYQLLFYAWIKRLSLAPLYPGLPEYIKSFLNALPFGKRYLNQSVVDPLDYKMGDFKGLWWEADIESVDITQAYYSENRHLYEQLIGIYNRRLKTEKTEAFVKKQISMQVFALLKCFHIINKSNSSANPVLLIETPLNRFIFEYYRKKHAPEMDGRFFKPRGYLFLLFIYHLSLIHDFFRRGFLFFKKREKALFLKEAVWGCKERTLRDDFIIDGNKCKKEDLLFYVLRKDDDSRQAALNDCLSNGYRVCDMSRAGICMNGKMLRSVSFNFFMPLFTLFVMAIRKDMHFFYDIIIFHRRAFFIEILMNLVEVKVHISTSDHDDIVQTIMMNKYGVRNVIIHWSDLTQIRDVYLCFVAHNVYYLWGNAHISSYKDTHYVENHLQVGCIYKSKVRSCLNDKDSLRKRLFGNPVKNKVVMFFDTSFDDGIFNTEKFYVDYLELIRDFAVSHPDVFAVLKPKSCEPDKVRISSELPRFRSIWDSLNRMDNFRIARKDEWCFEEAIGIADVSVSMGMNTPATVALICGQNAFYYDDTGNFDHPFAAKYLNEIVFMDKERLLSGIDSVLSGDISCRNIIDMEDIRQYDHYDDDQALERLRGHLVSLTQQTK
jgi:hypothetical protein